MKKLALTFALLLVAVFSNAQSFQIHQSYNKPNDEFTLNGYTSTRIITDYFWTSDDEKWNLFQWASFDSGSNTNILLYAERRFDESNLYWHFETRYNSYCSGHMMDGSLQIGLAYLIPWENGASIYITPKYFAGYEIGSTEWASDFMLSINSSYEGKHIYYEGYIDTRYVGKFSYFAEQKAYYKITDRFQLGICGVVVGSHEYEGSEGFCKIQPYLSIRTQF